MRSFRNKTRQSIAAYIDYVFNDVTSGFVMANILYDTNNDLIAQYGKCHSTVPQCLSDTAEKHFTLAYEVIIKKVELIKIRP